MDPQTSAIVGVAQWTGVAKLPAKCELRVTLSWTEVRSSQCCSARTPNPPVRPDHQARAFVSLETWGKTLVMVRESARDADAVALANLVSDDKISLVLYWDQAQGICVACTPAGKVLGKVMVEPNAVATTANVRLLHANSKKGRDVKAGSVGGPRVEWQSA